MGRLSRLLCICAALAAFTLLAVPTPAVAAKPKPCWQRLINDWFDGRIDNAYPIKCYREAIRHLPSDAQEYSSAPDDIRRALLAALRDMRGGGNVVGRGEEPPIPPAAEPVIESSGGGFFRELLARLGPKNADSIPIPLLVLAGIAFLLLGAATASYVARWFQTRRAQLAATPATQQATRPGSRPTRGTEQT